MECQLRSSILCVSRNASKRPLSCSSKGEDKHRFFLRLTWSLSKRYSLKRDRLIAHLRKFSFSVHNVAKYSEKFTKAFAILFLQLMVGVVLFMVVTVPVSKSPSYAAIRKMLATLDDPFTRFLEPVKLKSLRSGTQSALTGVGVSIGSGLTVTVARYETPDHIDINKVGIIPDHPLPVTFPEDDESFCGCLGDPATGCYLNRVGLFSR